MIAHGIGGGVIEGAKGTAKGAFSGAAVGAMYGAIVGRGGLHAKQTKSGDIAGLALMPLTAIAGAVAGSAYGGVTASVQGFQQAQEAQSNPFDIK